MILKAQGHKILENSWSRTTRAQSGFSGSRRIARTKKIIVPHCPTLQMLVDFCTKPLQGALFGKFGSVILGYQHVNTLVSDPLVSSVLAKGDLTTNGPPHQVMPSG